MECLVRKIDTWMDHATLERIEELRENKKWEARYLARERKGDVIEERPDGYWSGPKGKGFRPDVFELVCCPGVGVAGLDRPLYKNEVIAGVRVIEKRRRYSINTKDMISNVLSESELDEAVSEKVL